MAAPEHAAVLERADAPFLPGITRHYFGTEFCPWAFPGTDQILAARAATRKAGRRFSLLTPVIYETFLPRLRGLLEEALPEFAEGDEVVISDWGALEVVRAIAPAIPVVLGRALSGQKRGPRILDLELNAAEQHYFRQGSWYGEEARALLAEEGIARIELDNLLQGIEPVRPPLRATLHTPFAMVTVSRNCPFLEAPAARCPDPACGEVFLLETPETAIPLWQGGNAQFLRNEILPEEPERLGIDRLVLHPFLPR